MSRRRYIGNDGPIEYFPIHIQCQLEEKREKKQESQNTKVYPTSKRKVKVR